MMFICAVIAAVVLLTPARAQTLASLDPPSFTSQRSANLTDLLFLYALENADCQANLFPNAVTPDVTGNASYSGTGRCPSVTNYTNAYNGVRFKGSRLTMTGGTPVLTVDDSLTLSGTVGSLYASLGSGVQPWTLEMWIIPDISSSSSSRTYALFEIGKAVSSPTSWSCSGGSPGARQFDFRLLYNADVENFEIEYRSGSGASACSSPFLMDTTEVSFVAGTLYQLTLRATALGDGSFASGQDFTLELRSSGGPTVTRLYSVSPSTAMSLTNLDVNNLVRFGSSGFTMSASNTAATTGGVFSWPGDILMVAMYGAELTPSDLDALYGADLPNSAPAARDGDFSDAVEDSFESVPSDSYFYDFDVTFFSAPALSYSLVAGMSPSSGLTSPGGRFRIGAATTDLNLSTALPAAYTPATSLTYRPDADEYTRSGVEGRFGLRASDGFASSPVANVRPIIAAQNDAPEAFNFTTASSVSQSTSIQLEFTGFDKDCDTGDNLGGLSCTSFGLQTLRIDSQSTPLLGKLYFPDVGECNGYTPAEEVSLPYNQPLSGAGPQTVTLCFEACLGTSGGNNDCPTEEIDRSAFLGTTTFTYEVEDIDAELSGEFFVSTDVTSVLSTETNVVQRHNEDEVIELNLTFIDNVCPSGSVATECTDGSREPYFQFTAVPPPGQVELFQDANLTEAIVPGMNVSNPIFVRPAQDYFNLESWPMCGITGGITFSACPDADDVQTEFPCVGPQCPSGTVTGRYQAFTVEGLTGDTLGLVPNANCAQGDFDGCPVELTYKMLVQDLESLPSTGMRLYFVNVNDVGSVVLPAAELLNRPRNQDVPLLGPGNTPVRIDDVDGDVRVVELTMSIKSTGTDGQLLFPEGSVTANNPLLRFSVGGGQLSGLESFKVRGVVSAINELLTNLNYRTTGSNTLDTVEFLLFDTSRDGDNGVPTSPAKAGITFGEDRAEILVRLREETEDEPVFGLPQAALWGTIGGGALCCIGFCCGVILGVVRAARRGNRTARWVLKNVLFTQLGGKGGDPRSRTASLEREMSPIARATEEAVRAEHARLEEVQWCVHLLSCLCPCCIKYNPDRDMVPDEERILVAVNDSLKGKAAAAHVPREKREKSVRLMVSPAEIFDWEEHKFSDPASGLEDIPYYYNAKTGQSSWLRPQVRRSVKVPGEKK